MVFRRNLYLCTPRLNESWKHLCQWQMLPSVWLEFIWQSLRHGWIISWKLQFPLLNHFILAEATAIVVSNMNPHQQEFSCSFVRLLLTNRQQLCLIIFQSIMLGHWFNLLARCHLPFVYSNFSCQVQQSNEMHVSSLLAGEWNEQTYKKLAKEIVTFTANHK